MTTKTSLPSRHETEAWLGHALDEMTTEQVDAFEALVEKVAGRYPIRYFLDDDPRFSDDPEHEEARQYAWSGALQVLIGDDTLEGLAEEWRQAKRAEREKMAYLTGAIIATADGGVSETAIAARAGLTRVSVRKALGK